MRRVHRVTHRLPAAALAALTLTGAATVSAVATQTGITVVLDGQARRVTTLARTAGQVLDAANVHLGPHDTLTPAASARVRDGAVVRVVRGRKLNLVVDQTARTAWVAATSVGDALHQLHLDDPRAYVSATRSAYLPLSGMTLRVRYPRTLTVAVDGARRVVTTTAPTITDVLHDAHVDLLDADRADAPLDAYPLDGETVTVTRVRHTTRTTRTPIAPATVDRNVDALPIGVIRVADNGTPGEQETTVTTTAVDGQVTNSVVVATTVVRAAQPRVVEHGTRDDSARASRSAPRVMPPAPSGAASGLNWAALAQCESGGNPRAVNQAGYYGLYQFDVSTWRSLGGAGLPSQASPAEQTARAQMLYAARGRSPWPVCGRHL